MSVVFACKMIHLNDDLFRASQFNHRLPEGLVADESVVDAVILFCGISLQVDSPYGTLCIQVLSHTCDRVVGPSLCRSSGWRTNLARLRCTFCFRQNHLS